MDERQIHSLDRWWRAANYLAVGQIYLMDNPMLREPLRAIHVKPRLLGHWGTTPGLTFVHAHLNRAITERDLPMLLVTGPGHGAAGLLAASFLEGTYTETYPHVTQDAAGMKKLFTQFSFPGGVPSHASPETPGSIHEGGELGYSLTHAYGAAFDNPDLLVCCVVGDGEAETGPLATSWHSNKFLDPRRDGAVLPVLHLNGYKIDNPTVLARVPEEELLSLLRGYGHEPHVVSGSDPMAMHQAFADQLDACLDSIRDIQHEARRAGGASARPRWPMIVLRSPKGWTGPVQVDGLKIEGTWRAHQVPFGQARSNPDHLRVLDEWLRSYRPHELFDERGVPAQDIRALHPVGSRRLSATPHANGGLLLRDLALPDITSLALREVVPGVTTAVSTRVLGRWLSDVIAANRHTFRLFSPDENSSNRLGDVMTVTDRAWNAEISPDDVHLAPGGRLMEVLSEHTCEGWLEGYLLTGRHGLFSCYEAFIHIVGSMYNQHAKWLESARKVAWRSPVASLNILLSSHVWRQDHNGFSHQDPGFIDHAANKSADVVRVYLPPDANSLLCVADHCLRSRDRVNVIVAGKQPALQYLSVEEARLHCAKGLGIWRWASSDEGADPDVVLACTGDVPTMEALAAAEILRRHVPALRVRFVNVVDLMRLQPEHVHPHGLSDADFDAVFTTNRPVVFAHHGYPWLVHRLTYRRKNHDNFHVHGYREEGSTTTPFDMTVRNRIDRFHLALAVIARVPGVANRTGHLHELLTTKLLEHQDQIRVHGEDLPEITTWTWAPDETASGRSSGRA